MTTCKTERRCPRCGGKLTMTKVTVYIEDEPKEADDDKVSTM